MSNFNLFILLIIFGVIVLAGIGAGTFLLWHHLRTRRLREQFGPEYDRTLQRAGGRKAGEAELLQRRRRHRELQLRDLDSSELAEFQRRWTDMQREFVDDPARAVHGADRLVVDVMSARGYPTDDLDRRADDLSVDHPHVAQHYRDARRVAKADKRGNASTEDLRRALTSYRALLEDLLDEKLNTRRTTGQRSGPGGRRRTRRDDDLRDGDRRDAELRDGDRRDADLRDGDRRDADLGDRDVGEGELRREDELRDRELSDREMRRDGDRRDRYDTRAHNTEKETRA
jgi:hypothetical protein